jgi:hypothetical protein
MRKIEMEEKKIQIDIKKYARSGNQDAAKVLAKGLVKAGDRYPVGAVPAPVIVS